MFHTSDIYLKAGVKKKSVKVNQYDFALQYAHFMFTKNTECMIYHRTAPSLNTFTTPTLKPSYCIHSTYHFRIEIDPRRICSVIPFLFPGFYYFVSYSLTLGFNADLSLCLNKRQNLSLTTGFGELCLSKLAWYLFLSQSI